MFVVIQSHIEPLFGLDSMASQRDLTDFDFGFDIDLVGEGTQHIHF